MTAITDPSRCQPWDHNAPARVRARVKQYKVWFIDGPTYRRLNKQPQVLTLLDNRHLYEGRLMTPFIQRALRETELLRERFPLQGRAQNA